MTIKVIIILVFILVVLSSLVLDLGLFSKKNQHQLTLKQSIYRSLCWFSLGLISVGAVYILHPYLHNLKNNTDLQSYIANYGISFTIVSDFNQSLQNFRIASTTAYFTGYILEYALSVDNLFVMLLIFQTFKISAQNEKRILLWGVIGAMLLRFVFVYLGSSAINQFHWILYAFGILLIYSGFKLMFQNSEEEFDPNKHFIIRLGNRIFSVEKSPKNPNSFFTKQNSKLQVTPLFLVLLVVEFTDVVFAVDSVPAVFGITTDPYLVFFSNIFAILGLRSLFFLLGHGLDKFYALKYGLSIILVYIGGKMLLEKYALEFGFTHIHNLIVIIGILAVSIFYSLKFPIQNQQDQTDK
jgi:tellurite resistance protein TerC